MSIKNKYEIKKIFHKECYPFLKKIHYAHRIPNICHSFGLFNIEQSLLVGIITFGLPPSPFEQIIWNDYSFFELNRLCLIEKLEKNVLSYFVSNSIKKLPENTILISYADIDYNHNGYIYQSTNWIYTGIGSINTKNYIMNNNQERHSRHPHLIDMNKVKEIRISKGKHRYYYFFGNKTFKKNMRKKLFERYEKLPYPKGKNKRYEILNKISLQSNMKKWF